MTDPRTAALAEALHRNPDWPCGCSGLYDENRHVAAILAALPPDWCGHAASDAERWRMHLECEWEADATIARLRRIAKDALDLAEEAGDCHGSMSYGVRDGHKRLAALRAALEESDVLP